jgi:hypothetical protein
MPVDPSFHTTDDIAAQEQQREFRYGQIHDFHGKRLVRIIHDQTKILIGRGIQPTRQFLHASSHVIVNKGHIAALPQIILHSRASAGMREDGYEIKFTKGFWHRIHQCITDSQGHENPLKYILFDS